MRQTPPSTDIRESTPDEVPYLETLYGEAFPDEDLVPVVRALLAEPRGVLSLVAVSDGVIIGHICFSLCGIEGREGRVALLAPLAVNPLRQGQGTGAALVRIGLERVENCGIELVCVLGDPSYYGRFGFAVETRIAPPYPLPEAWREAWRSVRFGEADNAIDGTLSVLPDRKSVV